MKVLVTGGTGVIGEGLIPALLDAGHSVRLLSRGAGEDARAWPDAVEPFAADVTDAESLDGAAEGCDAVIHVTGIVDESPPKLTFERVNVEGTKNVLAEAARAGARRFVYVSSLGAERGRSGYHRSKFRAEEFVRASKTEWLILRPGNVYGPSDEVISTLLKLIRTLPAAPVIDGGEQPFQPVWYEDLGRAVVRAIEVEGLKHQTLELAGEETTTTGDLIERLAAITGRSVTKVSVPSWLASLGVKVAEAASLDNLLGGRYTPTELVEAFRERCAEVMPLEFSAEPGTSRVVEEGATLTLALPVRGNVQVRVVEAAPRRVRMATVEGHMLAGVIEFAA